MQKQNKEIVIKEDLDWSWGISIERLKESIKELEEMGADTINIESHESYGSAITTINATQNRLETDEEFEERKIRLSDIEKSRQSRDLETLAMLKAKYE